MNKPFLKKMLTHSIISHNEHICVYCESLDCKCKEYVLNESGKCIICSCEECECNDITDINTFISKNPYPSYEEISHKMARNTILWFEYGEENHNISEKVYNNIMSDDTIKEIGKKIADESIMLNIYFSILWYSPVNYAPKYIKNEFKNILTLWNIKHDD